jgi:Rrf2 family protein
MHISARADYAVRAVVALADIGEGPVKSETLATAQAIPQKFLESILNDLRHAGLVRSQRGPEGGYWLNHPAEGITVADVIRAVDGPLATVRGQRPEDMAYDGPARPLQRVWIAVRHNLRDVLERTTVADIANGALPAHVEELAADRDAWRTR